MKEHEHPTKSKPEEDGVAKKAYAIYVKEGRPQGHADQNWLEAEGKMPHAKSDHPDHQDHHAHMARILDRGTGFQGAFPLKKNQKKEN